MRNYIQKVLKKRQDGESGFSLVELAVVIVVMGILVAVAIPVFSGMQQSARDGAAEALAANVSSMVTVAIAAETPLAELEADIEKVAGDGFVAATGATLDDVCVTVTLDGSTSQKGAGCADAEPTAVTANSFTGLTYKN